MNRFWLALGFSFVGAVAACGGGGSGETTGSGGGGAGGGGDGGSASVTNTTSATSVTGVGGGSGGGAPGVCNTLPLPASVTKTADPSPLPAFTGGTIVDGTYVVTSIVDYGTTSPGGTTVQEVYQFEGGKVRTAIQSSESPEAHYAGTYSTSGTKLAFTVTCPGDFALEIAYTATATTLAMQHGSDPNEVAYATKQ